MIAQLPEPAYALAFSPDDVDEVLIADAFYVGLDGDRQRGLEGGTQWDSFRAVWDTNEWWSGPLWSNVEETPEFRSAAAVVVA